MLYPLSYGSLSVHYIYRLNSGKVQIQCLASRWATVDERPLVKTFGRGHNALLISASRPRINRVFSGAGGFWLEKVRRVASGEREKMSTILVIDDDPALHHLIEGSVAGLGYQFCHATSGEEGLDLLTRQNFDLLIFDYDLEGIDGKGFLDRLRRVQPSLKVIMLTGQGTPQAVLTALSSKVCDLLVKPSPSTDVQSAIIAALGECRISEIEILSAQRHWIQLRVPCDLNSVPLLQKLLTQLQLDLPEEIREGMAYAFREMINNAIEHGGKLDPAKHVEVLCVRMKRAIVYWIKDPGEGFDPDQLPHAAVSNPENDPFRHVQVRDEQGLRAGGFGILLTNQLVDELVYNERRNELMFIKYL